MLRLIVLSPFLLVLVVFALSNTASTSFGLWPTDLAVQAPLSVAVLVVAAVFFLLGALLAWTGTLTQARRARRAELQLRQAESQLELLKPRSSVVQEPGGTSTMQLQDDLPGSAVIAAPPNSWQRLPSHG